MTSNVYSDSLIVMIQSIPITSHDIFIDWLNWVSMPSISFLLFIWIVNGLVSIFTKNLYPIKVSLWITLIMFFLGYIPFKMNWFILMKGVFIQHCVKLEHGVVLQHNACACEYIPNTLFYREKWIILKISLANTLKTIYY